MLIILFFTGCGRSPQHISEEKETVESLIHILKSDAAAHIRAEAAHRLGHSGDTRAEDALIESARDGTWLIRKRAIIALKYFPSKKVEEHLRKLVDNAGPKNQILAIEVLYLQNKADYLSQVISYLKSNDPEMREIAASTFSFVPEKRFLTDLKEALEKETNPKVTKQLKKAITFIEESE